MNSTIGAAEAQLVVRSNIHLTNLDVAFRKLLQHEQFVDVTLSCDGVTFKCHRLILAASSPLFEKLFANNCDQHPIVIIPIGIQAWTMQALIDFMYRGQVSVQEGCIDELFESAKMLQITSLCRTQMLPQGNNYYDSFAKSTSDSGGTSKKNYNNKVDNRTKTPSNRFEEEEEAESTNACEEFSNDDGCTSRNFENIDAPCDSRTNDEEYGMLDTNIITESEEPGNQTNLQFDERDVHNERRFQNKKLSTKERRNNSEQEFASICDTQFVGAIRVKPKDMLFEGRNCNEQRLKIRNSACNTTNSALDQLGLTFDEDDIEGGNGNVSTLPLKEEDCDNTERANLHLDEYTNDIHRPYGIFGDDETQGCVNNEDNEIAGTIHIKSEIIEADMDYTEEAENIVVQPNVSYIYSGEENFDSASSNLFNNFVNGETDFISSNYHFKNFFRTNGDYRSYANANQFGFSKTMTHPILHKALAKSKIHQTKASLQTNNYTMDSLPKLRAPRSNQARNYCSKDLHNALMAVKHGDSIYNASRKYKVPRKTLRNWMKRMEIKSKFPMPKQLKDYTRKKQLDLAERQLQMQLQQQQDIFLT